MFYGHYRQFQSAHRLAKHTYLKSQVLPDVCLGVVEGELSLEEGVRVGYAGSYEDFIIFMFEPIAERKDEAFGFLLGHTRAFIVVGDSVSGRLPVLAALTRSSIGPHAALEERVYFLEAVDV